MDFIPYADEIAEQVGCRPDLTKLFLTDPFLAFKCFFGACVPAQYRLMGPGKWQGAKKTIEQAPHNVVFATKTRTITREKSENSSFPLWLRGIILLAIVIAVVVKLFY